MNKVKFKYLLLGFLFLGILNSCQKDDEGLILNEDPNIDQVMYRSDIFGVVRSEGEPVNDVTVTFNGEVTYTDSDGVYNFNDIEIGSQHNVVKLSKEGYFDGARTFRSAGPSTQFQQTILQKKNFDRSFDSSVGASISKDRVTLHFPAQSIVVENSGELYDGEVQIAMEMIDPSLYNLTDIMPGDMTAREDDNTLTTLQSFGMVNVELQSPDGQKLQVGNEKSVDLSYIVNDKFLNDAPEVISMWSFDYDLGLWVKEGEGMLEGNIYTGSVSHFSTWNFDISAPSVVVHGKILADDNVLTYYHVSILNADNKGGSGMTDSEGVFSGRVEAGVELTLRVYSGSNCWLQSGLPIYQQTIGPFSIDQDLGTIQLSLDDQEFLHLTGTALDCSMNPLPNGRLVFTGAFNNITYPIIDGVIDISIPVCTSMPLQTNIRIVDPVSLLQTTELGVTLPGEIDLMEIVVCDETADHFKVDNLLQGNFNVVDSLEFFAYTTAVDDIEAIMYGANYDISYTLDYSLKFNIGNAFGMDQLEVKSYDLSEFNMNFEDDTGASEQYTMGNGQTGEIVIETIVPVSGSLKKVTGSYSVECTDAATGGLRTLTGSFSMDYNE